MKEFELKLTENELNYVFSLLSEKPFKEVYSLINKIQNQFIKQQEEKNGS